MAHEPVADEAVALWAEVFGEPPPVRTTPA